MIYKNCKASARDVQGLALFGFFGQKSRSPEQPGPKGGAQRKNKRINCTSFILNRALNSSNNPGKSTY